MSVTLASLSIFVRARGAADNDYLWLVLVNGAAVTHVVELVVVQHEIGSVVTESEYNAVD